MPQAVTSPTTSAAYEQALADLNTATEEQRRIVQAPSRRAIFGAAVAIPAMAATAATALTHPRGALSERWSTLARARTVFDARRGVTDQEIDEFIDGWYDEQAAILTAPITSPDDAIAQLECAASMAAYGVRSDEQDVAALAGVAAYFRGRI